VIDMNNNTLEHLSKAAMEYTDHEEAPLKARDFDEERILNPTAYFASLDELEYKVLKRSCLKLYVVRGCCSDTETVPTNSIQNNMQNSTDRMPDGDTYSDLDGDSIFVVEPPEIYTTEDELRLEVHP